MGTLQKLQNSIQTLISFWPVYPIHTNSLFWVKFVELPFCHFPPPNTSIRGKGSKIQLIFYLNILVFQTSGKQPYPFPVLSRFCNGLYTCDAKRTREETGIQCNHAQTFNTQWGQRLGRVFDRPRKKGEGVVTEAGHKKDETKGLIGMYGAEEKDNIVRSHDCLSV